MAFGNQMAAKWGGMNMAEVYADWAESLDGCTIGAISHGIELSKKCQHPPNQGEFVAHCQSYKPAMPIMIDCKLSPEQIESNRKRIAKIAEMLAGSKAAAPIPLTMPTHEPMIDRKMIASGE